MVRVIINLVLVLILRILELVSGFLVNVCNSNLVIFKEVFLKI